MSKKRTSACDSSSSIDRLAASPSRPPSTLPEPRHCSRDPDDPRISVPGQYELKIDGKSVVVADAADGKEESWCAAGPNIEQAQALRAAINRKNQLFFYRWRPQNITYLFGFRKHEQGNNAIEIPQFDPLVAEQEKVIARLKKPMPHRL